MATERWKKYLEEHYKEKTGKDLTDDLRNKWKEIEEDWLSRPETALNWFILGVTSPAEIEQWRATKSEAEQWRATNFSPEEAKKWIDEGIDDPCYAIEWKNKKFSPEEAKKWIDARIDDPYYAIEWKNKRFTLEEAKKWIDAGIREPEQAKKWKAKNFSPAEAKNWGKAMVETPQEAKKWINIGVNSPGTALTWKSYRFKTAEEAEPWIKVVGVRYAPNAKIWKEDGFTPQEATRWIDAGITDADYASDWKIRQFTPEEAKKWIDAKVPRISDAIEWRAEKFSPAEAKDWITYGFKTVEEAKQWRVHGFEKAEEASTWKAAGVTRAFDAKLWKARKFTPTNAGKWVKAKVYDPDSVYEWKEKQFTLEETKEWTDAGFQYAAEAKQWKDIGVTSAPDAKIWKSNRFTPKNAKQWIDKGANAYHAVTCIGHGVKTPEEFTQWRKVGVEDPDMACRWIVEGFERAEKAEPWIRVVGADGADRASNWVFAGFKTPEAVNSWYEAGVDDPYRAKDWEKEHFTLKEVKEWTDAGFKFPDKAKKWILRGFTYAPDVKRWMDAGVGLREAEGWLKYAKIADPDEMTEWVKLGVSRASGVASWKSMGIPTPKEAKPWIDKGFRCEYVYASYAKPWIDAGWGKEPKTITLAGMYKDLDCEAKAAAIIAEKTNYLPPERYEKFTDNRQSLKELFKKCNGKNEKEIEKILSNIIANINNQQTNVTSQLGNSAEAEWAIKVGFDANNLQKIINDSYKINQLRNLSIIRFFVLPDPMRTKENQPEDKVTAGKIYKLLKEKGFIPKDNKKLQWVHCKENIMNFYTKLNDATKEENKNEKTYASAKKILELWKLPYSKNDDNKNETNNKAVKKYLMEFLKNYTPEQ